MREAGVFNEAIVLPVDGIQLSSEIAVERWENEGGAEKVEIGAVVALYQTRAEAEVATYELLKVEGDARRFTIVGALENAAGIGGSSALNAELINLGIPADRTAEYETQINSGMFALIAQGSDNEVHQMKDELAATG